MHKHKRKRVDQRIAEVQADKVLFTALVYNGACKGIHNCPTCMVYGCASRAYLNPLMGRR